MICMDRQKASKILGITEDATDDELKSAFRNRVKETHPDIHPENEEEFKEVANAYSTITSLDEVRKSIELLDKRDQIIEAITATLIKKRNKEIDRITRTATKKIYILTIGFIPFLIAILTILHGLLSMTQITPYAIMIFLLIVLIAMLTLIDRRDTRIQEVGRRHEDIHGELVCLLRDPRKLEHIHHRLRKAFELKKVPMEKEEIIGIIHESIKSQLRELSGDTLELYKVGIMDVLSLRGDLQVTGNGSYNVK